jgi:hypothetical protein
MDRRIRIQFCAALRAPLLGRHSRIAARRTCLRRHWGAVLADLRPAGVRASHQRNCRWLSGDVYEKRDTEGSGSLTNLAGRHGLMTVNFDPAKAPLPHRAFDHRHDAPPVARGVDEGKTNKAFRMASDQACEFCVGCCIVVMEEGGASVFHGAVMEFPLPAWQ